MAFGLRHCAVCGSARRAFAAFGVAARNSYFDGRAGWNVRQGDFAVGDDDILHFCQWRERCTRLYPVTRGAERLLAIDKVIMAPGLAGCEHEVVRQQLLSGLAR